jgi:hypothetical protein
MSTHNHSQSRAHRHLLEWRRLTHILRARSNRMLTVPSMTDDLPSEAILKYESVARLGAEDVDEVARDCPIDF